MKIAAILFSATFAAALLFLAGCKTTPPPQSSSAQKTHTVELFNGRDLEGWTFCMKKHADPAQTWSVSDGVMHCTGQPYGYARTTRAYHDYKLAVIWRFVKIAPHANDSGIFVHIQPPDKVWPVCVQDQGMYQHLGDLFLMSGASADGHPAVGKKNITIPQLGPPDENPPGEWNTNQIICSGNAISVFVNGKTMNEITGCSLSSGYIGIQSEGGDIEVRRMFLEPLK